jgi:hypothetical protein
LQKGNTLLHRVHLGKNFKALRGNGYGAYCGSR